MTESEIQAATQAIDGIYACPGVTTPEMARRAAVRALAAAEMARKLDAAWKTEPRRKLRAPREVKFQ